MIAQDYKEIADDLQEVTWDIEDARYTDSYFSDDRMRELENLYKQCNVFIAEYNSYKNFKGIK